MNKKQIEWCEYELTTLFKQLDREDNRMERYEAEGNTEKYAKAARRYDMLSAKIDGIQAVLHCLGYHSRVNDDWNRVDILKNDY